MRLVVLVVAVCLSACEKAPRVDLSSAPAGAIEQGIGWMATHCLICHRVDDLTIDEMLAPPLWAVRAHYLAEYPEPQTFVNAVTAFVIDPQADRSLLPYAVEHYGLKAPVSLDEEKIRAVAWAIYAGQVERPVWAREYKKRYRESPAVW